MNFYRLHIIDAWQGGLRTEGPATTGANCGARLPFARREGRDPDPPATLT